MSTGLSNTPPSTQASPKILLVKLSSLGDILHNLPIVWDIRSHFPEAQIDWVVEESYVHLLKPLVSQAGFRGIDRIIPFGLRRWKKRPFSMSTWQAFFAFRRILRTTAYDVLIETQGLLKSAIVCALAKKNSNAIVAGLANATEFSGYEPAARLFYTHAFQVPFQFHAVDRSRWVMSSALKISAIERSHVPLFYPQAFCDQLAVSKMAGLKTPYILCFHSTARESKRWSDGRWVELGKALSELGYQMVFPWGNLAEKGVSKSLASQIPGALIPPAFSIEEAFPLIAGAALTLGVDTGLTHLAAVLGKPTVEIYCDSPRWKTEGYWSNRIRNTGDIQAPPNVQEVLKASLELLA